jgi:hypothetical protein
MSRVSKEAVILISNGTPDKRLPLLQDFCPGSPIECFELELSLSAQIINVLRTELKDKPLSHAFKDPVLLAKALNTAMQAQERRKEEEAMTDPKKRLLRLMLKAKAKMKEEKARAEAVSSAEQVTNTTSTE